MLKRLLSLVCFDAVYASICQKRNWLCTHNLLTVDLLLPLMLFISLFICSIGFFFGKTVSPYYFYIGLCISMLATALHSLKRLFVFIGSVAIILLLTTYTFSYTGTDASAYHLPMQRLLIEGWNPIFDSSLEKFNALILNKGLLSPYHTLFLPKVSALCGAIVAKGTGLWCADAFLGYTLILTLFCTSIRFSKCLWQCSSFAAFLFACCITCSTKITSFLAGQVDYTAYAGFMIATFGCVMWQTTSTWRDLVTFGIGLLICMLAKTTGFLCGFLLLGLGLFTGWRKHSYYWFLVIMIGSVFIIGAAPLLTAWIQYGSPFYPSMTFSPTIQPIDITSDFIGNADGERMGYLARIVYAWFSQTLAIKGCAWWYDTPTFQPEFYVVAGVGGLGTWFRLMVVGSLFALACSKKNAIFWLSLFILLTANIAPLKYIGYNRYFPQMWALPFLAIYNLLYACQWKRLTPLLTRARPILFVGLSLLLLPILMRTLAYQARSLAIEGQRQALLKRCTASEYAIAKNADTFTLRNRARLAGITFTSKENIEALKINRTQLLIGKPLEVDAVSTYVAHAFPICDTPRQLLTFHWLAFFNTFPHPLLDCADEQIIPQQ